jgi:tetrahydromethanopterin S-methyltransferase subunit G
MADNVVQTLQHLLQDVIAPDVRELKVRLTSLEKHIDVRFEAVDQRFDGIEKRFEGVEHRFVGVEQRFVGVDQRFDLLEEKMDMRFDFLLKTLLGAISESRAQTELTSTRQFASLSERVAVLEARANS